MENNVVNKGYTFQLYEHNLLNSELWEVIDMFTNNLQALVEQLRLHSSVNDTRQPGW